MTTQSINWIVDRMEEIEDALENNPRNYWELVEEHELLNQQAFEIYKDAKNNIEAALMGQATELEMALEMGDIDEAQKQMEIIDELERDLAELIHTSTG